MSNILIIKHGSLGDIVQINGALKDIKQFHKDDKIFILSSLISKMLILSNNSPADISDSIFLDLFIILYAKLIY